MNEREEYALVLVNHAHGIISGCKVCKQILSRGTWGVGLKIGEHHYLVGENPPRYCCGEEKKIFHTFNSEEEASALAKSVQEQLSEDGTTENLMLHELYQDGVAIKIAPVH